MSKLLSTIKSGLIKSPFFSTLPANILTIPLEMLADYKFSYLCDSEMNTKLTGLVFSAPAFYILALILLYFRYVKSEENKKGKREKEENQCKIFFNYCINVLMYLFPPILWIIMLLLDGDYMACSKTDWKGEYVLDDELKRKWCKPTEFISGRDETELQILTFSYIHKSEVNHIVSSDYIMELHSIS